MYKLTTNGSIIRLKDGAFIPADPASTDYSNYLKWVEEGNTADPADEPSRDLYGEWKADREAKVTAITVIVDGMEFDGDETSQNRMARAVTASDSLDDQTEWTLANNMEVIVTARQLKRACRLAGEAQTAIWSDGRPPQPAPAET